VRDGINPPVPSDTMLTLNNTPPTAGLTGPATALRGTDASFTFRASDPSSADQAAGFCYQVAWGDGSPPQVIDPAAGNGAGVAVRHTYSAAGLFTVQLVATDKDGDAGAPVTAQVAVQGVALQNGVLTVTGTGGDDTIVIALTPGSPATAAVTINNVPQGS